MTTGTLDRVFLVCYLNQLRARTYCSVDSDVLSFLGPENRDPDGWDDGVRVSRGYGARAWPPGTRPSGPRVAYVRVDAPVIRGNNNSSADTELHFVPEARGPTSRECSERSAVATIAFALRL